MTDHRTSLLQLLARLSFKLGDFTLSSGGKSDYYVDCRTTTLHAEGARLLRQSHPVPNRQALRVPWHFVPHADTRMAAAQLTLLRN